MISTNLVNNNGILYFNGVSVVDLVKKYGTGMYAMDEERIREKCRAYQNALRSCFGDHARAYYASKAASFKRIYEIVKEEGMGVDVVPLVKSTLP